MTTQNAADDVRMPLPAAVLRIALLAVLPLTVMAMILRASPAQLGIDFHDYWLAARRILDGAAPYAAAMLAGPVDAMGQDRYRYPPLLAQALAPLGLLPAQAAYAVFAALSAVLLAAGSAAGALAAGASRRTAVITGIGISVSSVPAVHSLLVGNVEGPLAAMTGVALIAGPAAAGAAVAAAALVKLVPAAAVPALAMRLRGGWRGLAGFAGTALAVMAASVILSTESWTQYPHVLANLLAGSAHYAANLAPDEVVRQLSPSLASLAGVVRIAALAGAAALIGASAWLARRPGGWAAALCAATAAGLLVPAAFWAHYLALLLPFAAFAWVRSGGSRSRFALIAGLALSDMLIPGVVLAGGIVTTASCLWILWPRGGAKTA